MVRKLLIFTFVCALAMFSSSAAVAATLSFNAIEQIDEPNINITVNQSTLNITGASGQVLEVVSLTGKLVATFRIDSPAQRVELNIPKGCYILKIGKVVRKVSIR